MNMSKWLFLLFTLCATSAGAGARVNQEVYVYQYPSSGWGMAGGSMAGAYNSADSSQHLLCEYRVSGLGTNPTESIACVAQDANGNRGFCMFPYVSTGLLNTLRSITDTSFFEFAWNLSTGVCTDLRVVHNSMQIPRKSSSTAPLDAKTVIPSREEIEARHTSSRSVPR